MAAMKSSEVKRVMSVFLRDSRVLLTVCFSVMSQWYSNTTYFLEVNQFLNRRQGPVFV